MEILIPAEEIQKRVKELAQRIALDYRGLPLTIVGVLTGSVMFVADLVRHMDIALRLGFIQASSYRGTTTTPGDLRVDPALMPDLSGRHVLLLDDILDTGHTLVALTERLLRLDPASLKVGVLLRKQGRQQVPFEPHYCCFEIPNAFVVGYGLDYNDDYRHLPSLAVLDPNKLP